MKMSEAEIVISGLPDSDLISQWSDGRFACWTSVCGVGIDDLDPSPSLLAFEGQVFKLGDPFSKSPVAESGFNPSARSFLEHSNAVLRSVLLKAVRAVAENYRMAKRQVVFCHLGKSRSPLVSVGAICLVDGLDPRSVWAYYVDEYDADPATELGLSALAWIIDECRI